MKVNLRMALKGLLQEAFRNQTLANFDLKHSLCPTSAVVCISGVKDEQHQQINHLRDTTSRVYSYISMFRCEMCRSNGNRTLWSSDSSTFSMAWKSKHKQYL